MNTELQIIKSEKFGEITADIYSDSKDMYMTSQQLGECLEYSDPKRGINRLVSRHEHLKDSKFSVLVKLTSTDGKAYNTRIFNEDGIYEIAFLSNTDKAFEFREWVRGILKALRKGELNKPMSMEDIMIYQLESIKVIKHQQEAQQQQLDGVSARLDGMKEVIQLNATEWRNTCQKIIVRIAEKMGGHPYMPIVHSDIYGLLEKRAGCNLKTRRTNKQHRMADNGVCKSKCDKVSILDVIADDKKLIEIYVAIVKDMALKYDITMPDDIQEVA